MAKVARDVEMYRRMGETPPTEELDVVDPPADPPKSQTNNDKPAAPPDQVDPPVSHAKELSDDDLLAEIQKRNPKIKSLADIQEQAPAAEDEKTKTRKKQAAVLSFALKNEIVSRETYDDYQVHKSKTPREVVYADYAEKRTTEGAKPEDINKEFSKIWHEEADDDIPPQVLEYRKSEMEKEKDRVLRRRFPEMLTLEQKYDQHVEDQVRTKANHDEITTKAQTYVDDVNSIFDTLDRKVEYSIGDAADAQTVDFEFPEEMVAQVKEEFLQRSSLSYYIANTYSKEVVQEAIRLRLLALTEKQRIAHTAKRYSSAMQKKEKSGRINLNPDEAGAGSAVPVRDEEMYRRLE